MVSYLDQTGLEHTLEKLRNQMYPVGSLYFSTNSTSPATIYGGTWERYGKGRTLVSVNESDTDFTAGKTGGEKTHNLRVRLGYLYGLTTFSNNSSLSGISVDGGKTYAGFTNFDSRQSHNTAKGVDGSFGNNPVDWYTSIVDMPTMDPYVAVYIWRRTA